VQPHVYNTCLKTMQRSSRVLADGRGWIYWCAHGQETVTLSLKAKDVLFPRSHVPLSLNHRT